MHWYDKIWGCALSSLCFPQLTGPFRAVSRCPSSSRATQPTLGMDLIEVLAVAITAVCCLELSLQFTSLVVRPVLQILHDLNFYFRPVLGGGSARNFNRRLCRQTLQASVPVLETARRNGHRAGLSHSSPFTPQPSTWRPVRALSCVPEPEALVGLLHRCCCCERATHVVCKGEWI